MDNEFLEQVLKNTQKADEPRVANTAKAENNLTNQERLEEAEQNEHDRIEDWRTHFYKHFKVLFSILCVVFVIILGILLWHWIAPSRWLWLSSHQLDNLKNILLAVFASSAVSNWTSKIK